MEIDEPNIPLFGFLFFITHHSISVTHHSSLKIKYSFGTIIHFSSLNIFGTICGPHACHRVRPKLFCSRGRLSSPFFSLFSFLFSHFPFPLQPYHCPEAQTQTPTWVRQCDLLRQSPVAPTKGEESQTQQFSFTVIIKTQT